MRIDKNDMINLFENNRQYTIPVYQRNYEWQKDQCIKLFEDIVEVSRKDRRHFCGSIVYKQIEDEAVGCNINSFIIIDGQQRLTTLYILLKAMYDCETNDLRKEDLAEILLNKNSSDPYSTNEATKMKLKPIKSDNKQLLLLIENKFDEVDKKSGIWINYELFCELIRKTVNENYTIQDILRGIKRLNYADIRLSEEDDAQEIFERINSTGIPLSLQDKIRNFVLMTDVTKVKNLNKEIYENDNWNEDIIKCRAEKLANQVLDTFKTEEPKVLVSYQDPNFKIYSCDNESDATGKILNYFRLCGESINCVSFSDMLKIVIDRLYERDNNIISDMALNNDNLDFSQTPFFSYDKDKVSKPTLVKNTNIYHRNGFSARTIIWLIKCLLDRYDIDYDEFEYSAKQAY